MTEIKQRYSKQNIEFKRKSVLALYLAGESQPVIVRHLKHLKVNKMFVYRTITRFKETGSIAKRNGGGPRRTATTPEMIQKVKALIEENPHISRRQLSVRLNISQERIRYILKTKLDYMYCKLEDKTDNDIEHKKLRIKQDMELLCIREDDPLPEIIFSTEVSSRQA